MIQYRLATREDNQQLLDLTASAGMDGEISLCIDRKPDFFKLLEYRGNSKVYVAEENQRIIGSLTVSLQHVYVGEKLVPVHYIGDFKVAKSHRNKGVGMILTNKVASYLMSIDADLVFLNVSKGNDKPFSFFTNRSVGTDFENIGSFTIYQFIGKNKETSHPDYNIQSSEITEDIVQFFSEAYKKYELGSLVNKEKLNGTNIYTIRQNGALLAAMCLFDTMDFKQNIVTKVSWKMNLILKMMNKINPLLGLSNMAELHQPVRMMYIKYIACRNNSKALFRILVNHARTIAYRKSYSFVSIGLHENDPQNNYISGMSKFTFKSIGLLSSLKKNRSLIDQIKRGIPFEDYSLV